MKTIVAIACLLISAAGCASTADELRAIKETRRAANGETVAVSRFSQTFVRAGGQWRCVYGQSTPLPVR